MASLFGVTSASESRWCVLYVLASYCSNIGQGLVTTVVGPTQLYLAQNLGVGVGTVNLVWTFGFAGYFVGALAAGFVFKRYFTTPLAKVSFVGGNMFVTGLMTVTLPFIRSFPLLALARIVQYVALGAFNAADASMIVFTMGPIKSRPFTNGYHASVGVGFLVGTFLVRPFLPAEATAEASRDVVCNAEQNEAEEPQVYELEFLGGIQKVAYPFMIAGAWAMAVSLIYLVLGLSSLKMPRYYEEVADGEKAESHANRQVLHWRALVFLVGVYYFISCGIERIYQPMVSD